MSHLLDRTTAAMSTLVRRWWGLLILIGVVLAAMYIGRDIPNYPANQANAYRNTPALATALATVEPKDRLAAERDLLQYQTDNQIKIWTGIVQGLAAVVLAVGGYFTWRNLRVAQEGQITNRFSQAIDQLGAEKEGKPNLEVRLGGIYALERIARDSPRDHWTIMEILTAYVRENARWVEPSSSDGVVSSPEDVAPQEPGKVTELPPLGSDIQAILTVIGRRMRSNDGPESRLELAQTDLRRANLWAGHLEMAGLSEAHLECAALSEVHLEGALLWRTHLEGALFLGAHLEGAVLWGAHLEGAQNLTQQQVYSASEHGDGAVVPADWPANWRDNFRRPPSQPGASDASTTHDSSTAG